LDEVRERRWIRNEYRRICDVVDLVLERQREHPEEHEDSRLHDYDNGQPETAAAQLALRPRSRLAHCRDQLHRVFYRTWSNSSANASEMTKNTTTTADCLPMLYY